MSYTGQGESSTGSEGLRIGQIDLESISGREGGYATGAERALMSALLFDGIQAFLSYASASSEVQRKRYKEAFSWVTTRSSDYVFSFENVCEALGVDPESLRCGLVNAASSEREKWMKMRRNF